MRSTILTGFKRDLRSARRQWDGAGSDERIRPFSEGPYRASALVRVAYGSELIDRAGDGHGGRCHNNRCGSVGTVKLRSELSTALFGASAIFSARWRSLAL